MTVLTNAMTTRNRVLTTVKALERALRRAEFEGTASDPAPFFSPRWDLPAHEGGTPPCGLFLTDARLSNNITLQADRHRQEVRR